MNYLKMFINSEIHSGSFMKSLKADRQLKNLSTSAFKELQEKLFTAERNISQLRLLVLGLNIIVFLFLMDKSHSIVWLTLLVIFSAVFYAIYIVLFQPYRKY